METVLNIISILSNNFSDIIASLVMVVSGIIGVAMLIPGDFPEKQLQGILDFLKKFSKK